MGKLSHIERTAHEPRGQARHSLLIDHITQVTPTIRLFRLSVSPEDRIGFLPGQWVDLYPPQHTGIAKPGGFTLTSAPSLASHGCGSPHLELAVQHSPDNPVAAYLFRPAEQLLRTPVSVRIGGSFVFPPPRSGPAPLRRVVFVAGGMGVNPMMSMLSHIAELGLCQQQQQQQEEEEEEAEEGEEEGRNRAQFHDLEVKLLYSFKESASTPTGAAASQQAAGDGTATGGDGGRGRGGSEKDAADGRGILFLDRIAELFGSGRLNGGVQLFLTSGAGERRPAAAEGPSSPPVLASCEAGHVSVVRRRMTVRDVEEAIGSDKASAVVYICGVPTMTDEFVQALVSPDGLGLRKDQVLFEKWW
ncbi:hypothetical protein VTJ83DRAFT_5813 [Remersonia thermophila]|uniref:FAD-binding FR-type domain-containing protein n=1 Tax=Remersonia thermophila TaxID=72144 RepID=A0ABR4D810_9PEZI